MKTLLNALKRVQTEHKAWAAHNFPNSKSFEPLLGIIEEAGELESAETAGDIWDAIADMIIFLCDYCNREDFDLSEQVEKRVPAILPWRTLIGKLAHYHLKGVQGIRYSPEEVIAAKKSLCAAIVVHICVEYSSEIVERSLVQTWSKVKLRDWKANPINANKVAEQ